MANPNRSRFHVVPRLAEAMGFQAWCDVDGAPVGASWLHLAGLREAYQAECAQRDRDRAAVLAKVDNSPEAHEAARARWRLGWSAEDEVAWSKMAADQRNGIKRPVNEAEIDRRVARECKRIERTGRRR